MSDDYETSIRDKVRSPRQRVTEDMRETTTEPMREAEPVRERKRKRPGNVDEFYIPENMIPPGSSYEWKRSTVYGASDPGYDMSLRENGWLPVDSSRMPGWMPDGYAGPVIRKGMILMERPIELTEEARMEQADEAFRAIRAKEEQMASQPSKAPDLPRLAPQIKRGYEPLRGKVIPA